MPDKDPSLLFLLWEGLPSSLRAAIMSFVVATLRVMYDGKEPSFFRRLLEAALCGAIAMAVTSGATAIGIGGDLSTFVGGAVGLLGADKVRSVARRRFEREAMK